MTITDVIRRAQQAQQDNPQQHDVQLSVLPFVEPEIKWATAEEYRREWHDEFDHRWFEFIHTHYDREG